MNQGDSGLSCEAVGFSDQLKAFSVSLENSLTVFRKLLKANQREFASEFNSVELFVRPNENRLTDILGYFLDPNANHGQGRVFLDAFLRNLIEVADIEKCKVPLFAPGSMRVEVTREDLTDQDRRIDLTLKIPLIGRGDHWIGLENKAYEWTAEQSNQVGHYAEHLCKVGGEQFWMIYLTPTGSGPSERSISGEQVKLLGKRFICLSYGAHIVPLIEQFQTLCRAENVRRFLREFAAFLRKRYLGEETMNDASIIDGVVRTAPAIITHYAQIGASIERLRRECYEMLAEELSGEFRVGVESPARLTEVTEEVLPIVMVDGTGRSQVMPGEDELQFSFYSKLGSFMMFGATGVQAGKPKIVDQLHQYLVGTLEDGGFQVGRDKKLGQLWHAGTWHFFSPEIFAKQFAPVLNQPELRSQKVKDIVQGVKVRMNGLIKAWEAAVEKRK